MRAAAREAGRRAETGARCARPSELFRSPLPLHVPLPHQAQCSLGGSWRGRQAVSFVVSTHSYFVSLTLTTVYVDRSASPSRRHSIRQIRILRPIMGLINLKVTRPVLYLHFATK